MVDAVIRKAAQIMSTVSGDDESIEGYDRAGRYYHIERDEGQRWYIVVKDKCGSAMYDGWWPESEGKSLAEAVQEAVRGACLVPERAAQAAKQGEKP